MVKNGLDKYVYVMFYISSYKYALHNAHAIFLANI